MEAMTQTQQIYIECTHHPELHWNNRYSFAINQHGRVLGTMCMCDCVIVCVSREIGVELQQMLYDIFGGMHVEIKSSEINLAKVKMGLCDENIVWNKKTFKLIYKEKKKRIFQIFCQQYKFNGVHHHIISLIYG